MPDDDISLVNATLRGDQAAFAILVDRTRTSVYRAAYRITGSVEAAQDATQEAYMSAYRSLAQFRGDGPFGAWVARIAARAAIKSRPRTGSVSLTVLDVNGGVTVAVEDTDLSGFAAREDVRGAVRRLPEPYREIVVLRFFADLPLADIAAVTGRNLNTIKTQLRRGLERLAESVGDERRAA